MKYIITTIFFFFAIHVFVQAQPGTGRINGIVKDAEVATFLESATVIVYKPDSTVLLFKITDKNGRYDIAGLPLNAKYVLAVSFAGYNDVRLPFTMDAAVKKIDTIFLQIKSSNEVVVTSIAPVRMNGDTLEINPAAFKMSNDAVAEDLLNKVPGIVVWADGSITMNGKVIPKVLVDGKPFLGSKDHRVATQNLPKNIIDKIQVYNEIDMNSETNRSRITDTDVPKDSLLTMNIKLKADKKSGYFGKYGAGIGTDGRYQADAALQFYNKQSSIAAGGGTNNINAEIAGLGDIQRESTFRNNYATYKNNSNFGRSGINRVISPGILFAHSFSQNDNDRKTNRITAGYDYDNNLGSTINQTYQERYLKDGDQLINSQSKNNRESLQHILRITYNKILDYNKRFSIDATGRNSNTTTLNNNTATIASRQGTAISDRAGNSTTEAGVQSFNANINYTNFDSENPLKAIEARATFARSQNTSDKNENSLYNFYTPTGTNKTIINRHYNTQTDNTTVNGTLTYNGLKRLLLGRFNFFGIGIATSHNIIYKKDDDENKVFDIDTNQKENANKNLTYSEATSTLQYVPSLSLNKNFTKWSSRMWSNYSLSAGVNKQFITEENTSSRINRNVNRDFSFVRFSAGAYYNRQVTNTYNINGSLNYGNGYGYPTISQIAPVVDSINLYSLYKGGLNLVNNKNNNLNVNINYATTNAKKPMQFSAGLNGSFNNIIKPFVDSILFLRDTINISGQDSTYLNGKQVRYTINGNKRYNSNIGYNTSLSRKIKGNQVQLQYTGSFGAGQVPSYIDNIYTVINTRSFTQSLKLNYYYKTILITGIGANANFNNSKQHGYKNSTYSTRTFTGEFNITVNATKNASLSSNLNYSKNNGIIKPITIWNANATYRFLKSKQAELKFTATDILKQFRNISYSANPDGVTSSVSNGLQQYFMVTLSYFPRKFGGGGKSVRGTNGGNNNRNSRSVPLRK